VIIQREVGLTRERKLIQGHLEHFLFTLVLGGALRQLFQGQSDIEYPIDDETVGCVLDVECWEKDVWFVIFKDLINDIPHVRIVRVRYPLVNNHALAELAVRQLDRKERGVSDHLAPRQEGV